MTHTSRIALLLGAAALLPALPALAADYEPPIVVDQAEEYVPVEVGSGWYLRGDIGYIIDTKVDTYTYRTFNFPGSTYNNAQFDTQSLNGDFTFGGGVGYRFNDWLRADVTADGFRAKFSGTTSAAIPCIDPAVEPTFAGTTCRSEDSASMSAVSIMANGYVDLGTFVGVTPYVGAGVGYSYVSWSRLNNQIFCVDGAGTCPPAAFEDVDHDGAKDWRFTYAFMAGAAYDISNNLKLDVGYRYRSIKGGDMFRFDAGTAALGASGIQGKDSDLQQHEVKVGLRYEIW